MVPWLRAHTELPEDLSSVPGMHIRWFTPPKAQRDGVLAHMYTYIFTQVIKIK